jgi:hypothetical protein
MGNRAIAGKVNQPNRASEVDLPCSGHPTSFSSCPLTTVISYFDPTFAHIEMSTYQTHKCLRLLQRAEGNLQDRAWTAALLAPSFTSTVGEDGAASTASAIAHFFGTTEASLSTDAFPDLVRVTMALGL